MTVSGTSTPSPASTWLVQASAATTTPPQVYDVPPASTVRCEPWSVTAVTGVDPSNVAPASVASRCIAAVPRAAGTIAPRSWNSPSVPSGTWNMGKRSAICDSSSVSNSIPTSFIDAT